MAKISVNQLAKFLASNSAQHRSIIKTQIENNTFTAAYYRDAQKAITDFLLDPSRNEDCVIKAIDTLEKSTANGDYEIARLGNNIEALDSFLMMYDKIQYLENCQIQEVSLPCPKVNIEGVDISVAPNCIVSGTYRGHGVVGAIKLYFGKLEPLSDEMAATITVVTKRFLEENFQQSGSARHQICQVVDVFAKSVYPAPSSHIRKIREIAAACEEIKFWWDALQRSNSVNQP